MKKNVCFSFFIFCVILSQGILAKFLEKDVEESSKNLVREKRVIDRRPAADEITVFNGDYPYVVNIKRLNALHCVGTILSHRTVITAARCVENNSLDIYKVYSGAAFTENGDVHNVTEIKMHGHNPSRTSSFLTGIALITVNPPFVFSWQTKKIGLHTGPALVDTQGIVAGWGCRVGSGPVHARNVDRLRIIHVPIMDHLECRNIYRGSFPITEEDVCTYHQHKSCADHDAGAPLIINNQLAGVHIGLIRTQEELPVKPDVFVLLQNVNYRPWILNNIVH